MIESQFLKTSIEKLELHSGRIADCVGRLNHDQIWTRNAENQNSIGNLILHLCGNVRQWIGFGVGGQADIRDREAEFAARSGLEPAQIIAKLKSTVAEAIDVLRKADSARLMDRVTIQNRDVTKLEAIYQVVEHFAQHTGQIIFVTKMLTGDDLGYYKDLSRPKAAHLP